MSLRHRFADNAALIPQLLFELLFELFLQILHLLAQIACGIKIPMPVAVAPRKGAASLGHFFLGKFNSQLLLLSLAQDSERYVRSFGEGLQKLSQLARLDQNLVVQHFKDVVLLNSSSSSRTVRLDVIDNQSEAFRQTELFTHDSWHLRCVHPEIRYRDLGTFFVMSWHSWFGWVRRTGRLWRLCRRRRCLCECCNRQQRDDCDGEYGFHFHGLFSIRCFSLLLVLLLMLVRISRLVSFRA